MNVLYLVISLLIMAVGLIGSVVPVLPGLPVVYLGYAVYGLATGWRDYGWGIMLVMGLVTAAVLVLDYLVGAMGAKRYGASWVGMAGAVLGAVVGLIFFNVIGLIVGPLVGAFAGEILRGRSSEEAFRAGWGAFLGFVAGSVFKLMMGLLMIGVFLVLVVW
ncbi:MAG: DUF456 domain-containing protein [Thermodesulfobacteriota bacterium]